MKRYAIGVDIGGSHITAAIIDLQIKKIKNECVITKKIDNKGAADQILTSWVEVISKLIGKVNIDEFSGIGFAMPGPFDYVNGIGLFERNDKFYGLYNVNIKESIKKVIGKELEIRFINDATAFAIGEAWIGCIKNYKRTLAITLGTGFGSAFMEDAIPVLESNTVPAYGCLWHLPFKEGIADDYFSTRWFVNAYKELTGIEISGVKDLEQLAVSDKDKKARSLFELFGKHLGIFLKDWVIQFGVEAIVIGGNLAKGYKLFGPSMETVMLAEGISPKIHLSSLFEDAALLGAARLFENNYYLKINPLLSKM